MNKLLTMMVALVVTLFSVNSFAWDPPATPAPASWISDTSGVLSAPAHARLDAKLKQINQASANEVAALIVPTLDGQSIEDVTNATFKAWGVGKKGLDNGVLIVLAMKEHKSRIETGKGVEGDLPDLKTQDILVQARPYLRKGDVEGALGFIFDSSASAIANHKADLAAGRSGSRQAPSCQVSNVGAGSDNSITFAVIGCLGLGLLFWYLSARTRRRHEREEALAELQRETARLRAQNAEKERARQRKLEAARLQHLQSTPAPVVQPVAHTPPHPITRDGEPVESVVEPTRHAPIHLSKPSAGTTTLGVTVAAGIALAAAEEEARRHRAEEDRKRRQRDQDDEDRRRRQREDDDRRRREDDDRRSSSSSSSSDWSSGGGSSGGFGGGDSGGGGGSSDW
jgi:uncharacterized membrane protein YgcG